MADLQLGARARRLLEELLGRASDGGSDGSHRTAPHVAGSAPPEERHAAKESPAASEAPPSDEVERAEWRRIQKAFFEALEHRPEQRTAFLRSEVAEDVLARVQALLAAHEAEGPLEGLRDRVMTPLQEAVRSVTDLAGETVLHFEVEEKLGAGGMGVVYRATDTRLGRPVALKFLSAHLLADPDAKRRFLLEAKTAAAMDHPNLCTIHEVGETDDGHLYIAMTFYEGESLKRRIARGRLSVAEALDITAQVARGLACAAEHDIVHRDIKPANLILTEDGTVKIVDFGLAKIGEGQITQTGALMGTVSYMSPEQTHGHPVDQRSDVWALGVVLYEMLTGKRPFRGGMDAAIIHAILNQAPQPLDEVLPGIGPAVSALVERTLRKDPRQRYADAASLLRDVEALLADPDRRDDLEALPALPPEGERRLVVVLACSLTGFESLLDRAEPDRVDAELARARSRIRGVVENYGGVLNEFAEDQAVALFGVPLTHEDDTLRAARAVLEIREAWGEQGGDDAGPDGSGDAELTLRFAINSAQVPVRATERDGRPYRVGGTVVRDTFLLAAAASPWELLASPHLRRSLEPFLETEARDAVSLSGGSGPVTPIAVLGSTMPDRWFDESSPAGQSRFVGRDVEMESLVRALASAASGAGRLVSVTGDAGVGKSRLVQEFRALLAEDGVRYVQGRCQAHAGLAPLQPLVECVRGLLGVGVSGAEASSDLVVDRIRGLAPELEVYLPILLHVMSVGTEEHPLPDYLSDDELRIASAGALVSEALVSTFTLGSGGRPLVLLLEDWHWADGASADVLELLAEMVPSYPLLVVVTARPEGGSSHRLPQAHLRLDLPPLRVEHAAKMMRSALHGARVSAELAEYVLERAGGNPFFIEELCRTLSDSGALQVEAGEARIVAPLDGVDVPDTIQAVLRTRLDRLDPEAREVLRCASVIGRDFGSGLLRRVVPSPGRMKGALDALRGTGLIQRVSLLPEPTYRFKHALTLDVTYDSLLERQRKERHAVVGRAIEDEHAGRLDEHVDALARHFARAEAWDEAIRYGKAAVEHAAGLWRFREAVEASERTRRCVERRAGPEDERREALIELLLDQERFLERLGQRARQQEIIEELLELVPGGASAVRARVLVRRGELMTLTGRFARAADAFESALADAEACGALEERAHALRAMGHRLWRMGRYQEALAPLTELVEQSRRTADPRGLVRDLLNLGRVHRDLRNWDEAWALAREAEDAEPRGSRLGWGYVANFEGHLLRAQGRLEEAVEAFDRATRIQVDAGLDKLVPLRHSLHLLGAAAANVEVGRIERGLVHYRDAVELARRANRMDHLGHALTLTGDVLMTLDRPQEAVPLYEEAVEALRRLPPDHPLSHAMTGLARALEAVGDPAAARTWREARALRLELEDRKGALEAMERETALLAEDDPALEGLLGEALDLARELGDARSEARTRNRLAIRAWRGSDLDTAASHFELAARALRPRGASPELGVVLNGLGAVLGMLRRFDEAEVLLEEALDIHREHAHPRREADALAALGKSLLASGQWDQAEARYRECLEKRREARDRLGEGWALARLAELALAPESSEPSASAADLIARAADIGRDLADEELQALCVELGAGRHPPHDT